MKVNGVAHVGQALFEAMSDPDVPGSSVQLTVRQAHTGKFEDIRVRRISTLEVAGRCKLFDNFSDINDRLKRELDHEGVRLVEQTIDLWENQLIAQNDRDEMSSANWAAFQETSIRWCDELKNALNAIESTSDESDATDDLHATDFSSLRAREPVTQFSSRRPASNAGSTAGPEILDTIDALCSSLDEHLGTRVGNREGCGDADDHPKSTLGFKYNSGSLSIEALDIGGPAYNSGKVFKGDSLLAIDNVQVTKDMDSDKVSAMLRGEDVAGSSTTLLLRCNRTSRVKQVMLIRMPSGDLGDSLFTPPISINVSGPSL